MKRILPVLALLFANVAFADTASDEIAAGRAAMVAHNLPLAHTHFQAALTAAPTNQTAAALLGITQLFDVTAKTESQTFLTNLGVDPTGRDVYNWSAKLPKDVDGELNLPTNYKLSDVSAFWLSTLVQESAAARANLALVTNPNFLITLTAAETKMPVSLNMDYGDVLMAQACLRAAEFLAHLGSGQDLDLNLDTFMDLMRGDMVTLQRVLADNPNFLKVGLGSERTAAKAALQDMIALYRQASVVIRARPAGLSRLFMLDSDALVAESEFRQALDKIELSLTEPVQIGEKFLYTGPLFGSTWSLKGMMPTFSASGFEVTTIPDASLGGVVSGLTKEGLAAIISDKQDTLAEMGWEWVSPTPQGSTMKRYLHLSSGTHLVTGAGGGYLTSSDGSNWTAHRIPGAGNLEGLVENSGTIVAAAYDGCIYVSTDDAVTWTRKLKDAGAGFHAVAYGNGTYVAVGDYGVIATSSDGNDWDVFYPNGISMLDMLFNGTLFVAVGIDENNNFATVSTSPDGQVWTQRLYADVGGAPLWGVTQNGSTLVAVGGNTFSLGSSNKRAVSTDGGINWTTGDLLASPTGNIGFNGVRYINGSYVAAGTGGTIATSADGVNWTKVTLSSGESFLTMVGVGQDGSTTYVLTGGGVILKSTDNITFSRTIALATAGGIANQGLPALRVIDGKLYVGGGSGTSTGGVILSSSDGLNFTSVSSGHYDILDIIKQGSTYYAVGGNGTIRTSSDGVSWATQTQTTPFTNAIRNISYLNGLFIITGSNDMVRTSATGAADSWSAQTTGFSGGQLYGAAYGNGVYVVVGGTNNSSNRVSHVLTSPDGNTWTQRNVGSNDTFRGVVFYQGTFTAVGTDGAIIRSSDGINW
ncbi:MAG: exo-alpha-sialidase, partial [Opitutaceae bacterium]|nr:exo-alpha-sialidase [Opitutaceae bacterium]